MATVLVGLRRGLGPFPARPVLPRAGARATLHGIRLEVVQHFSDVTKSYLLKFLEKKFI